MTDEEAKKVLEKLLETVDRFPIQITTAILGEALRIAIEKLEN